MAAAKTNIELDQGVDHKGRTFGYDHRRKNFIIWGIENGRIVVASVEHDEMEPEHGSLLATKRDALSVAKRENSLPNSQLLRSIRRGFQRD